MEPAPPRSTYAERAFAPPPTVNEPPAWFGGSWPEYVCYRELQRQGYEEGYDFVFQSSQLGGKTELGGVVVDFYFETRRMAINIQGVYWHYVYKGGVNRGRDLDARQALGGMGIMLIFIDDDDLLRDPPYFVSQALQGVDHSRLA